MPFDVKAIALQKHQETQQDEKLWLRALESARLSLKMIEISYPDLEQIALASRSPEKFTVITRLIYQYGKSHPHGDQISDIILQMVNESPFSLSDWIDTIDYFYGWLVDHTRKVDFLPMLKFLECSVVSPEAQDAGQTLLALTADMLSNFGYEG